MKVEVNIDLIRAKVDSCERFQHCVHQSGDVYSEFSCKIIIDIGIDVNFVILINLLGEAHGDVAVPTLININVGLSINLDMTLNVDINFRNDVAVVIQLKIDFDVALQILVNTLLPRDFNV